MVLYLVPVDEHLEAQPLRCGDGHAVTVGRGPGHSLCLSDEALHVSSKGIRISSQADGEVVATNCSASGLVRRFQGGSGAAQFIHPMSNAVLRTGDVLDIAIYRCVLLALHAARWSSDRRLAGASQTCPPLRPPHLMRSQAREHVQLA